MSDLASSARALLIQYAQSKHETHTEIDVLRVLRDQATLLYERQMCVDALTQDPMRQLGEYATEVKRIQEQMQVVSCHRLATHEGLSSIDAVVQLMGGSIVQLSFSYERRPMIENDIVDDSEFVPGGTHIQFSVEVSKDYGERQRLLIIECWAVGQQPSQTPAVPMNGWEDMDEEAEADEDAMEATMIKDESSDGNGAAPKAMEATVEATGGDKSDAPDQFAAYLDPDVFEQFQKWTGLETMDEGPIFFLLMTFPFYEPEWDLVDFVLETVFAQEDDDEGDEVIEFDAEGEEADSL